MWLQNRTLGLFSAAILIFAFPIVLLSQERSTWPPIPDEDLALKDNPAEPGSSAMILIKKESRDDQKRRWETFYRIKIFNENGRDYGDIQIPYVPGSFEVDEVAARIVQTDGRATEFHGPIYEKTLARTQRHRFMAKAFTLPYVKPGAIIDYRYVMKSKLDSPSSEPWIVQERLFIRSTELEWRPPQESIPWRASPRSLSGDGELHADQNQFMRTTIANLPGFQEEPLMPPEETVKMRYVLYRDYRLVPGIIDPVNTLQEYVNDYIGKPNALASAVKELTSPQDPVEQKVRKIYRAVQERIRNLSYEETYTKQERKRENIKERKSAQDVWRFGYGTENEIVFLFIALCRAAGINADAMAVTRRDGQFFDPEIPRYDQLTGWLAVVDLTSASAAFSTSRIFDPGVRFAPAGFVSWTKQGVKGIRLGSARISEVEVSLRRVDENQLRRMVDFSLRPDGSADVNLVTTYSGEDAVERRNDFFDLPKAGREQLLRNELKDMFPAARIQEVAWEGMDDAGDEAKISYRFELRGVGQVLSSRMVVEPRLFQRPSPFPNWSRIHPVYLRRSVDTFQEVRITPPPGYQLEQTLPAVEYKLNIANGTSGVYVSSTSEQGGAITHITRLTTTAVYIAVDEYVTVKRFFDQVAASERSHLILRKQ